MVTPPEPVERDSRGILDPMRLGDRIRLRRHPSTPALEGLVDRFWTVTWDLPPGVRHRQEVLTHPSANVSVGSPDARDDPAGRVEARLTGVAREVVDRELGGRGWTVAAMTTPGGLGAFLAGSAADLTGRVVGLAVLPGLADPAGLVRDVEAGGDEAGGDEAARVAVLAAALEAAVRPERARRAREVAAIARVAETDRSLRRLDDLARHAGVGPRTLQRMFLQDAGVSPTWVLRRYRLLDAAEAVRGGERVAWATLADALGYADQAHLVREFRAALGRTPEAYARSLRS